MELLQSFVDQNFIQRFMDLYRLLFHPFVVLPATAAWLAYREWRVDATGLDGLGRRLGTLGVAVLVAVAPVAGFLILTGRRSLTPANVWYIDLISTGGLVLASATAWTAWTRNGWGTAVTEALIAVVTAAVPFAAISLVWNVSGHVTFTTVPTLYLVLRDRQHWPLLAIPIIMVVNRPFLGVHTWAQAVGGLVLGTAAVVVTDVTDDGRVADWLASITPPG